MSSESDVDNQGSRALCRRLRNGGISLRNSVTETENPSVWVCGVSAYQLGDNGEPTQ